jgi:hypothetical protein
MRAVAQKHPKTRRERHKKAHPKISFEVRLENTRRE